MAWKMTSTMMVAAAIAALVACDDDDTGAAAPPGVDAGTSDAPTKGDDDDDDDDDSDAGADAGKKPREAPVFLAADEYEDLIAIDPAFPFGVTQVHPADSNIVGSHWGSHGGPMVTTGAYGAPSDGPKVIRWTVGGGATADAQKTEVPFVKASDLPSPFFYGADGMVDTPFGGLLSYTGAPPTFAGEALLYDADYTTVTSRAKTNGFYSGVGLRGAKGDLVVYSGLSELSTAASVVTDNGLYAAPLCNGALAGAAPCAEPHKLFAWAGSSGPVVTDAHGNVFVAASLSDGDTSDEVYALTTAQAFGGAAVAKVVVAAADTLGTASLAAIAPEDGAPGYVVGLGYAPDAPVHASPYVESATALAKGTAAPLANAIERADGVDSLYVFTDDEGDLWLAVTKGTEGTFIELRRRP
ncbi:MAG: hypothetical protein KIT84_41070 [Labilithrix sp.]|nr:hypothetical protein [Labilithrix sp.]MCW5817463.1 hypothetical protein [Labilithrix sp.]